MQQQKIVKTFYAGGTISSVPNDKGVREPGDIDLLKELKNYLYKTDKVFPNTLRFNIPKTIHKGLSENMTKAIHQKILGELNEAVENEKDIGILLTVGTDSMLETARFLQDKLRVKLQKQKITLAITGANEDITHANTDAMANLFFAVSCITDDSNIGKTIICFGGYAINPERAMMMPFNGNHMQLRDVKKSGWECFVENKKRNIQREKELCAFAESVGVGLYYVNVVDRENHNDWYHHAISNKLQAVVFVLYHSGTANVEDKDLSVASLVERLQQKGIVCFGVSQNGEPVTFGNYITAEKLQQAGMLSLGSMDYIVALIKITQLLVARAGKEELIAAMNKEQEQLASLPT